MLTNTISSEKHLRMEAGDSFELAGYTFVFEGTRVLQGPNFVADEGEFVFTGPVIVLPACTHKNAAT